MRILRRHTGTTWIDILSGEIIADPYASEEVMLKSGPYILTGDEESLPFVVLWLGQSESNHAWVTTATYNQNVPLVSVPSPANLTIIKQSDSEGVAPIGDPVVFEVTDATIASGDVSRTMGLVSVFLDQLAPGQEFILVDGVHDGSGRDELIDDTDTNRKWEDLVAVLTELNNRNWELNSTIEWWYSKDIASIQNMATNYSPHYLGVDAGGTTFTLGTVHAAGVDNARVDHCFWDADAPSTELGRGVFTKSGVSHMVVQPMPFSFTEGLAEFLNFTTFSDGSPFTGHAQKIDLARADIEGMVTHLNTHGVTASLGPSAHNIIFGGPTGGGHPNVDSPHGLPQVAYLMAISMAAQAGVITLPQPEILSYTYDEAAPNRVIANISLPEGGSLTTARIKNNVAAPVTPSPHQQEVVGFEVARFTETEDQRRPIFLTTETSYPSAHRGTVTILNAATTVEGQRVGQIAIDMEEPWQNGDTIYFGRGSGPALLQLPRDWTNEVQLDLPIVDIPTWEPAGLSAPWNGLPVLPMPPVHAVVGVPAPAGPTELQFASKAEGSDGYLTGPFLPANTSAVTVQIETRIPDAVTNSIDEFFEIQNETLRIDVDPRVGNRRIRVYTEDGAGLRTVNGALGTKNVLPADTWMNITLSIDNVAGTCKAWVDSTEMLNATFTPPSGGNEFFATNQAITLGMVSTMAFDVRRLRLWFNETSADGSAPIADPDHDLWGDVSFWNGTGLPAGWSKVGTAFT